MIGNPNSVRFSHVKILPFPGFDNAYLVVSGRLTESTGNGCIPVMSFVYADGEVGSRIGVEWETANGPIVVLKEVDKDYVDPEDEDIKASDHWMFPYVDGHHRWKQCIVNEMRLPEMFAKGDFEYIFNFLKSEFDSYKDTL